MDLETLHVYMKAMDLGEAVWSVVTAWSYHERRALGDQLTRAIDSIAANVSEGHGRYHYRDRLRFCYYARGSIQESVTWIEKAYRRQLFSDAEYRTTHTELVEIRRMLNGYIGYLRKRAGNE